MTDAIGLADRLAVTDIVQRFFWLVDHGRAAETAALFTDDATLVFGPGSPKPGTVAGAQIGPAMTARQAQSHVTTRHVLSNLAVSARPDRGLDVYSLLTLFRSEDEARDALPASVADVEDTLVSTEQGWRIRARLITPIFNRS